MQKRLTLGLSGARSVIFRRSCSTKSPNDNDESISSQNDTKDQKFSDPKERINHILKLMIKENVGRGSAKFESKFPNENKGFTRSQLPNYDNFKPDDSDELKLKKAAFAVAESIGENREQTESDLLSKAMDIHKPIDVNWSELISGMKVDKGEMKEHTRADEVKRIFKFSSARRQPKDKVTGVRSPPTLRSQQMEKVNLSGTSDLGIFVNVDQHNSGTELKLWNHLKENEMRIAITHPPLNYYQKMIMWTSQGKIWKFPIDNEQGMEAEQTIHFSEHVFLEPHLEGWCPTKGPVRHFMELVCVGLSKNPYFTVQEKINHIMWYKDYFASKIDLLQQTGALQDGFPDEAEQLSKQV